MQLGLEGCMDTPAERAAEALGAACLARKATCSAFLPTMQLTVGWCYWASLLEVLQAAAS